MCNTPASGKPSQSSDFSTNLCEYLPRVVVIVAAIGVFLAAGAYARRDYSRRGIGRY